MPELDPDFVRAQFPAFQEAALQDRAFFENAGGSFACRFVIWRLTRFYRTRKVQPYAPYEASEAAGAEMDEARSRLAAMLGVANDELSFGPSTTQNTYVLSQAFREMLAPGDAVVVTDQDHEANSGAWRRLAQAGIEVREWRIDPESGHLDTASLTPLLADGKVRLVAFPHCSNVVGEINDVAAICAQVRASGAWSCVDGVSYAPHGLPNVGALGADIYLFSAYKTYGPHQGLMVVRADLARQLPNQGHSFNGGSLTKRFTPAGPDHAQVAASAGMADYIDTLHDHLTQGDAPSGAEPAPTPGQNAVEPARRAARVHDAMRSREIALMQPLLDWIGSRQGLRLLGPRAATLRAPTLALALDRPGEEVARDLAARGIMAGGGDFYAGRPLGAMGVDPARGVLRLSFVHYTHEEEVARLIAALDAEI